MKPNQDLESAKWLSRYDRQNRGRNGSFPRIECRFQRGWGRGPGDFSFGGHRPPGRSALNRLTQEVLRSDPSGNYRIESAVLALIALIAAWPIAMMLEQVIRFLK